MLYFWRKLRKDVHKIISETLEISSLEEIQEADEDLAAKLGQVLETKTIVRGIKTRLEVLLR